MKVWGRDEVGMPAKQTNLENSCYGLDRNIYTCQWAQITQWVNVCNVHMVPALNWEMRCGPRHCLSETFSSS